MNIKERRKFRRLYTYHLAKYHIVSKPKEDQQPVIAAIRDIGGGGICLQAEEALPISCVIQLYINFPQFPKPIPCLARVTWVKRIGRTGKFEIGMHFIDIEEIFRQAIIKRIESVHSIVEEKGAKKHEVPV